MSTDSRAEDGRGDQRSTAIIGLLAAGLQPPPTKSSMVSALADARRAAAALQKRGQNLAPWLTTEIRLRGIRENAAVVAALEIAAVRDSVATLYRQRYPERTVQLDQFLAHIND